MGPIVAIIDMFMEMHDIDCKKTEERYSGPMKADYKYTLQPGSRVILGEVKRPATLLYVQSDLDKHPIFELIEETSPMKPNLYTIKVFKQVSLTYSSHSSDSARFCSAPHS